MKTYLLILYFLLSGCMPFDVVDSIEAEQAEFNYYFDNESPSLKVFNCYYPQEPVPVYVTSEIAHAVHLMTIAKAIRFWNYVNEREVFILVLDDYSEEPTDGITFAFHDATPWWATCGKILIGHTFAVDWTLPAHELGHTKGLGHSSNTSCIMYSWDKAFKVEPIDGCNGVFQKESL